jgi:hypothetical protein
MKAERFCLPEAWGEDGAEVDVTAAGVGVELRDLEECSGVAGSVITTSRSLCSVCSEL